MVPTTTLSRQTSSSHLLHLYLTSQNTNWYMVEQQLRKKPKEACSLNLDGNSALYIALNRSVHNYPPGRIVQLLLQAYPPALWGEVKIRGDPLYAACWRRASLQILQILFNSQPRNDLAPHYITVLWDSYENLFGDDPDQLVHHILQSGREGAEIWMKFHLLLRFLTFHFRPLHASAAASNCSLQAFRLAYSYFPTQIRIPDQDGRLPLHHCCASRQASKEKLEVLLDSFPEATGARSSDGKLPLHEAILAQQPWTIVELVICAGSSALFERCSGLFPYQLAAANNNALDTIYELVKAAPHLLMMESSDFNLTRKTSSKSIIGSLDENLEDQTNVFLSEMTASPADWKATSELLSCHLPHPDFRVLHSVASIVSCPVGLLKVSSMIHPNQLDEPDENGDTPLHIICQEIFEGDDYLSEEDDTRAERVDLLVNPNAAQMRNTSRKKLPLELAIEAGHNWESLRSIIAAWPDSLIQKRTGLYPYQLAASSPRVTLNELFQLVLAAPHLVAYQHNSCGVSLSRE